MQGLVQGLEALLEAGCRRHQQMRHQLLTKPCVPCARWCAVRGLGPLFEPCCPCACVEGVPCVPGWGGGVHRLHVHVHMPTCASRVAFPRRRRLQDFFAVLPLANLDEHSSSSGSDDYLDDGDAVDFLDGEDFGDEEDDDDAHLHGAGDDADDDDFDEPVEDAEDDASAENSEAGEDGSSPLRFVRCAAQRALVCVPRPLHRSCTGSEWPLGLVRKVVVWWGGGLAAPVYRRWGGVSFPPACVCGDWVYVPPALSWVRLIPMHAVT